MIRFGSACSGIEAASVAWHPLGWRAAWLAEIEAFPSAVLAHHYPDVPNLGDMTRLVRMILQGEIEAPDVFTGGTPCQAFSVAGKRESLADARGNLSLTFCEIADAIDHVRASRGEKPCVIKWENVPGVLSTKDNAFGCFLGALAGSGCELFPAGWEPGQPIRWPDAGCVYGPKRAIAWRVLDAQYFGLAQRRRRVFVVASARDGFDPARVLFESDGVRRDSAPRREAREVAPTVPSRSSAGGGLGTDFDCDGGLIETVSTLDASYGRLQGCSGQDANHGHSHLLAFGGNNTSGPIEVATAVNACASASGRLDFESETFIAFGCKDSDPARSVSHGIAPTLRAMSHAGSHANAGGQVAVAITGQVTHALNTANNGKGSSEDGTGRGVPTIAVAFAQNQRDEVRTMDVAGALAAEPGAKQQTYAMQGMAVRRLTPRECERLQGFPDDYTRIPWRGKPAEQCPHGPRYKALGNSWAVPCARWIGQRISAYLEGLEAAA